MDTKYKSFRQFDTVDDYSDHHFAEQAKEVQQTSNEWKKRIQQDWKVLVKNLPEAIFVRVYEERMDLLRAVIIGPSGTPYHDGLFFFDFQFPAQYPHVPPKAYYHSGGLRLNPNLYANGTVCLSLLNTWYGKGCEKWIPQSSTMLQVLVSIQALVLNAQPYFNEPMFDWIANTRWGKSGSLAYNESTFLLSCTTMMYVLRKPPKYFEDFVAGHFREHGHNILAACKAYWNGAQIGCTVEERGHYVTGTAKIHSEDFRAKLKVLFPYLVTQFKAIGIDCNKFLVKDVKVCERREVIAAAGAPKEATSSKDSCAQATDAAAAATTGSNKLLAHTAKATDETAARKPANSLLQRMIQYLWKLGKVFSVEK